MRIVTLCSVYAVIASSRCLISNRCNPELRHPQGGIKCLCVCVCIFSGRYAGFDIAMVAIPYRPQRCRLSRSNNHQNRSGTQTGLRHDNCLRIACLAYKVASTFIFFLMHIIEIYIKHNRSCTTIVSLVAILTAIAVR